MVTPASPGRCNILLSSSCGNLISQRPPHVAPDAIHSALYAVVMFQSRRWKLWAAAGLSAGLLELPFPLAGPLPVWRTVFAWFGLVPLLLGDACPRPASTQPRPLRRGFLLGYLCGVLWYMGNCYWVRDTMCQYGDMPPSCPTLLLVGYSLVLGLYFGLFGLGVALVRRATGSTRLALAAAPILWAALELAAARITSVPWDQLGYSQVDNALVNQLAPWTGVYGISFVLVAVNALIAGGLLLDRCSGQAARWGIAGVAAHGRRNHGSSHPAAQARTHGHRRPDPAQSRRRRRQRLAALRASGTAHRRVHAVWPASNARPTSPEFPQTGAPSGEIVCPPYSHASRPDRLAGVARAL